MVLQGLTVMMKPARLSYLSLCAARWRRFLACQSDPDIDITKLTAETDPADMLYNQGLANLKAGKMTEAAAQVRRGRPASTPSPSGRARLWSCSAFANYRQGRYRRAITRRQALSGALSGAPRTPPMRSISSACRYSKQIPDVTQDQRTVAADDRSDAGRRRQLSGFGICRRRADQDSLCARPARRQGNADRPLLSGAQGISSPRSPASASSSRSIRRPTRSKKRSPVSSKPIMRMGIVDEAQTAAAVLGPQLSRTASGTRTPTSS